ncbi:TonB-dependent receptor domain-containing protein [Sphingomonas sp. UYP23]
MADGADVSPSPASIANVLPVAVGPPAVSQGRADENVVRQAEDAFGATIGRETLGIYSSSSVRGFSPLAAGNARIQGLYFDQVAALDARILRSVSIKVGPSAQGYAFPAPTGVVDSVLRRPGAERLLSATIDTDTFGTRSIELDGELPVSSTLSIGAGAGLYDTRNFDHTKSHQNDAAATAWWRPGAGVDIQPFWSRSNLTGANFNPVLEPAGAFLPPRVRRDLYYGPSWATSAVESTNLGVIGRAKLAPHWTLDAGIFRSITDIPYNVDIFLISLQPDRSGDLIGFFDPPVRSASTSGEVRLTHDFDEGPRTHSVLVSVRGRDSTNRYDGSSFVDLGPVTEGVKIDMPERRVSFTAQNHGRVQQITVGAAYAGHWRNVGELSLGLSRVDYTKTLGPPGLPGVKTTDRPWVYNVGGAAYLTGRVALYAAYTRGFEETGVAPSNAANRGQALSSIVTEQKEAGIRWRVAKTVRLVVGAFDIRKPYLSLDRQNVYTTLGSTENRGIEISLSGTLPAGLSVAAGGVFLDPTVAGAVRGLGGVGKRPVGVPLHSVDVNLDWQIPGQKALSVDLDVDNTGRVAALVDNRLFLPGMTLFDLGARYRFKVSNAKATFRVQAANVFDRFAHSYYAPGAFQPISGRRINAYLAIDI